MPKLKPNPERRAIETAAQEISVALIRAGLSREQVMAACGFSEKTFFNRRNDPGDYTLAELQRLARKAKMDPLTAASIVLGRRVTARDIT